MSVPLRILTWVKLPPTHSRSVPGTWAKVRTGPLSIGVSSGTSEGKAKAAPLARSTAAAIETISKTLFLILESPFS
jgi:hypothetical protein